MTTSTGVHILRFCGILVGVVVASVLVTLLMIFIANDKSNSSSDSNTPGTRVTDSLKFIAVISRHGNRGSPMTYPEDPYPLNDTRYWPYGVDGLTPYGRTQMFNLGVKIRSLYNGFLNSTFHSEELRATSTYMDRLLMSGEGFLAGLYPPRGFQIWNKDILWQPTPIYSDSPDRTINIDNECPRFTEDFYAQFFNFPNLYATNISQMGDYYNEIAGTNDTGGVALTDLYNMWDKLISEDQEGYKIPDWTRRIYPHPLKALIAKMYVAFFAATDEMARLLIGNVFGEIVDAMLGKINGTLPDRRLQYYSGHDSSIVALQTILGVPNDSFVGLVFPGSGLVFELHQDNTTASQYSFQAIYIDGNSTDMEPVNLPIQKCGQPCDFLALVKNLKWFYDYDYKQECQNVTSKQSLFGKPFSRLNQNFRSLNLV